MADTSAVTNASQNLSKSSVQAIDVHWFLGVRIISWLYTGSNERRLCFHRRRGMCLSFEGETACLFSG